MSEISPEAREAYNKFYEIFKDFPIIAGKKLPRLIQDAIDASKKPSVPPLPMERGWTRDRKLVWNQLASAPSLGSAAWTLAMYACHKAGALGNPNLHHNAITRWLAGFWDDASERCDAMNAFCDAIESEDFTAAKAQAPIWKTVLASDALGNWHPSSVRTEQHYDVFREDL